jgi:hypothetical protein
MEEELEDTREHCSNQLSQRGRRYIKKIQKCHSRKDFKPAGSLDRILRGCETAFAARQLLHFSFSSGIIADRGYTQRWDTKEVFSSGPFNKLSDFQKGYKNELDLLCQKIESEISELESLVVKLVRKEEARQQGEAYLERITRFLSFLASIFGKCLDLFLCFNSSEYPNRCRPPCTTMPWNIWPALVVLWGVCWMFYTPLVTPQPDDASIYLDVDFDLLDVDLPNQESSM